MRVRVDGEDLTGCPEWQVADIQGLSPESAIVTTSDRAWLDGAAVTGARIGPREITMQIFVDGDPQEARLRLYEMFPLKGTVSLTIGTHLREVQTSGIVKRVECDLFKQAQEVDVTIVCPDPYLYSPREREMDANGVIRNPGLPVGIIAESDGGPVSDGTRTVSVGTLTPTAYILDTREGMKSVTRQSTGASLMRYVILDSGWPQCGHGETIITGATSAKIRPRWLGI